VGIVGGGGGARQLADKEEVGAVGPAEPLVVGGAGGGGTEQVVMRDEVDSKRRRQIRNRLVRKMKTSVSRSHDGATSRRIIRPIKKLSSPLDALFFCSRPGCALRRVRPTSYNYKQSSH
jgi:hypothetical protein